MGIAVKHGLAYRDTASVRHLGIDEGSRRNGHAHMTEVYNWPSLKPNQKQRRGYLERLNLRIRKAYLLTEIFRELWTCQPKGWLAHSFIMPLPDFAPLLRRHEEAILARFNLRTDNSATKAMNNNARHASHRALSTAAPTTQNRAQILMRSRLWTHRTPCSAILSVSPATFWD